MAQGSHKRVRILTNTCFKQIFLKTFFRRIWTIRLNVLHFVANFPVLDANPVFLNVSLLFVLFINILDRLV